MSVVILNAWQRAMLADLLGCTEGEVAARLGGVVYYDDPTATDCCCQRIPWQPHQHRYTLGEGRP